MYKQGKRYGITHADFLFLKGNFAHMLCKKYLMSAYFRKWSNIKRELLTDGARQAIDGHLHFYIKYRKAVVTNPYY